MSTFNEYDRRDLRCMGITTRQREVVRFALAWIDDLERQRYLLEMLSAETPQFDNPLHAMAAKTLRDQVLAEGPPKKEPSPS